MKIGAQLYTIRDYCKDEKSLAESLKKVADMGYTMIQASGICDCDPAWLKNELDKNGLICPLSHTAADKLIDKKQQVADAHKIINAHYVGLGWCKINDDGVDAFYNKYIDAVNFYHENGLQFMYHNHDHEFEIKDGKALLLQLADKFTPEQMMFTVDTYWAQAGGFDPAQLLCILKHRTPCIHLKDMSYDRKMEAIGSGNMNWDSILKAAVDNDVKYAFVEQDDCNGEDPFDCLKSSLDFLTAQGL